MKIPLVTISSAFFNTGHLIIDMVKSIFAQTFTDWELILIDDGSTDNSLEIANSIKDPRVRVFTNGTNKGRSVSLNIITSLARGRYIARMDSDDMSGISRIEKQVQLIESDAAIDVVSTGICYLDCEDRPKGLWFAPPSHAEICRYPSRTIELCHGSLLGKKTWFARFPYNEAIPYAIDYNLFIQSYEHSTFANVPEPLYYYRFNQSFNLKKQFIDRKISAAFLFEHQKNAGRPTHALADWMVQYGKFVITTVLFATGQKEWLMARRFSPLNENEVRLYLQEIEKIKNVELPIQHSHCKASR